MSESFCTCDIIHQVSCLSEERESVKHFWKFLEMFARFSTHCVRNFGAIFTFRKRQSPRGPPRFGTTDEVLIDADETRCDRFIGGEVAIERAAS